MKTRRMFSNVTAFKDRHGKTRWRYRKNGFTVALGSDYGSEEFIRKYNAATKGERPSSGQATGRVISGSPAGSLSYVIQSWYKSSGFVSLGDLTKYGYTRIAERLREAHGQKTVANLRRRHVQAIMAAKAATPHAANHDLRVLRLVLDHAMDLELIESNCARTVKKLRASSEGYYTWTEQDIQKFYKRWSTGTTAHLAMTLMLYSGAGKKDATLLGPSNIVSGRLQYRRAKLQTRDGVLVDIPIHPVLSGLLSTLPSDQETFLQTTYGKPRSANGLGTAMRTWCDEAKLPQCTSHGLRKACARRIIEAGATPHELMAVTGHKTLAQAQMYADKFARAEAADRAIEGLNYE